MHTTHEEKRLERGIRSEESESRLTWSVRIGEAASKQAETRANGDVDEEANRKYPATSEEAKYPEPG